MRSFLAIVVLLTANIYVETAFAQGAENSPPFRSGKAVATFAPRPILPFGGRIRYTTTGIFMLRVRPDGTVSRVDIVRSTGYDTFDLASMDALYKWRFVPGSADNVRVPITYLRGRPKY